jgi:D-alanyl-D-alanine dipeptidase
VVAQLYEWSDPRLRRVRVEECREPLLDVASVAALRLSDLPVTARHLRTGLVDRIVAAQSLLPRSVRIHVVAGFRSVDEQAALFAAYVELLRRHHPDPDALHRAASRHIAPPDVASHVVGGGVDLTLCNEGGLELSMGTAVGAPLDGEGLDCALWWPTLSTQARSNRRALYEVLSTVGLVNYPPQWWHWSYGDRLWAVQTGAAAARYGPIAD